MEEFKTFDPVQDIIEAGVKNASITLIGKRRSGKSYFIRDICHKLKKYYKTIYLFSGSRKTDPEFWSFISTKNQYDGIDEGKLNEIWDSQLELMNANKGKDKSKLPHVLIIFDDIIQSNTGARNSEFLCKLYSNGRHYNICSILATQSFKKVSKHVRDNTDITIAYQFKNGDDKEDFVKENMTVEKIKDGVKILDDITSAESHTCVVVLNYLNTVDNLSKIRKYKALEKVPMPKKVKENFGTTEYKILSYEED